MADNLTVTTAASGSVSSIPDATVIATDDVAGKHYQFVKIVDATLDGTNKLAVAADGSIAITVATVPSHAVTGPVTDAQLRATAVPVSAASLPLPALAATSTKQSDGTQKTQLVDGAGSIAATVLDFVNSNPLAVRLSDTNGDYVGAGAGTQYTEDVAAAADPIGTILMSVRRDTLSITEVSADGDNIAVKSTNKGQLHVKLADTTIVDGSGVTQPVSGPLTDAQLRATAVPVSGTVTANAGTGTLAVSAASLPLPTGASSLAEQQTQTTALQLVDDVVHSGDAVLSKYAVIGAVLDDTTTGAVTENQANALRMSTRRALLVEGVASGTAIPISGTVTANAGTGTLAVSLATAPALVAGTANIGDVDVLTVNGVAPAFGTGVRGATVQRVTVATDDVVPVSGTVTANAGTGTLAVSLASVPSHAVTNAGTFAVQAAGDVAHDGVDSGAPVKQGGKAIAHGTNPTAVAAADRTDWYFNRAGIPFVIGGHPNTVTVEAAYTAAQTDAVVVTVAAGLKIVVTEIEAICSNANTVNVGVRIGFGAVNTPTTTGVVLTHPGIAAGSGVVRGNGGGILGVGADDQDLRITCDVPTTGSIRVLVSYYTIES